MSKIKATHKMNVRKEKENWRRKISLGTVVLPIALVCVIVGIILISFIGEDVEPNLVVTPENVEELISSLKEEERTPIGSYEVKMDMEWEFKNGTTPCEGTLIENVVNNNNEVYCIVKLKNTGEEIYKSPFIPVGSTLENILLDKDLKKGEYDCILTYHLVDSSYKDVSQVSVEIKVKINH